MGSGEAGAGPSVRSQAGTPGVREGVEEGQGADPWRGLPSHGLEPGQRVPTPCSRSQASTWL